MKKTKSILLFLSATTISIVLFGQTKMSKFKIDGKVQGFSNGTKIYLNDVSNVTLKKFDSAIIFNNEFTFSGHFKSKYLRCTIGTADDFDEVLFWLENGLTTLKTDKGNFLKAVVKGSTIQQKWNELNDLFDTAKNPGQVYFSFIKKNPNSIISAYSLSLYLKIWSKDTVLSLYESFSKEVKLSEYGKKISAFISLDRNIKIGDKFVDFTEKDSSNKSIKLSDFRGKIVLLEFWGSWCRPCREENPSLLKIYNEFQLKGFEIIGIASESDRKQWVKAIKADGLTWTNVTDLKGSSNKAAMIYGVAYYPANYLIDRSGIIIAKDVYGDDLRNLLLKSFK